MHTLDLWRQRIGHHASNTDVVIPALSMLFAGAMTTWATNDHMVIEYDSVYYLSSAENLANGNGLVEYTGGQMTNFAPGFPLLIRLVMFLGVDSTTAARIISIVSVMATVAMAARIAHHLGPRWSASWTALAVATVPSVLAMHVQAMSEPVFTVALTGLVLGLVRLPLAPAPITIRHMAPIVLASWACCLIRYQGYVVVAAAALVLFLRPTTWKKRFILSISYALSAAAMINVIILQNLIRAGRIGAPVTSSQNTFSGDVQFALTALGRLFGPESNWLDYRTDLTMGLIALSCIGVTGALASWLVVRKRLPARIGVLATFVIALPAFSLASSRRVWVDFTPRILFPVLPFLVISAVIVVLTVISHRRRVVQIPMGIVALAIVGLLATQTVANARDASSTVDELNSETVVVPPLGRAVAALDPSAVVYSNNAEGIWLSSRRPVIKRFDTWAGSVIRLLEPEYQRPQGNFAKRLWRYANDLCDTFYLAWTNEDNPKRIGGELFYLEEVGILTPIEEFPGGTLYFVESGYTDLCIAADEWEAQNS